MSDGQLVPSADPVAAARFLASEHAGRDVHVCAVPRSGHKGDKFRGITFPAHDEAGIAAWIAQQAQQGYCAYWMPNQPGEGQRQSAQRPRFNEDDIKAVRFAYLDVDPVGDETPEQVVARVVAKLRSFRLAPTWFVCTGRGVQLLWRFKTSGDAQAIGLGADLLVSDADRRRAAREINYGLVLAFGGDAEGADDCYSLEHLYRIPGSLHLKDVNKPLRCFIVHEHSHPEATYEPGEFLRAPLPATSKGERVMGESIEGEPKSISVADLQEWAVSAGRVIPEKPLSYIATGDANDFDHDKSDMVYYVAAALDRASVPPFLIACALFDQNNLISEHIHRAGKRDAWSYAKRQVERAIGDNRRQAEIRGAIIPSDAARVAGESADPILAELNRDHAVLAQEGGKTRVISWEKSELDEERLVPVLQTFEDFRNRYMHLTVAVGTGKGVTYKPRGKWWLEHPHRRQYLALRFLPGQPAEVDGYLNMWRGWPIAPARGDWSLMREHIRRVLSGGNATYDEYIIRWCAWAFQNPAEPAEVALVLRGGRGSGKGIFARTLKRLFGQHGLQVSSPAQITGRFNAHLRDCCFLFADEAILPGNKEAEGALKTIITELDLPIEGKFANVVQARNRLHLLMASNDEWVVPAGLDERRFAVFNVSNEFAQRENYFRPLVEQMDSGGMAAMLHDLLEMDLGRWHPRSNVPQTEALLEQKAASVKGIDAVFLDLLHAGQLPVDHWPGVDRPYVSTKALHEYACDRLRHANVSMREVAKLMHELGFEQSDKMRPRGFLLPTLAEARAAWDRARMPVRWQRASEWANLREQIRPHHYEEPRDHNEPPPW